MTNDLITPSTVNGSALWKVGGTGTTTLSVSPSAAGALLVLATTAGSNTNTSAVSGGGCNASGSGLDGAWQRVAGPITSQGTWAIELWMGKVITAGASTITITNTSSGTNRLNCKEFDTTGGAGTAWTQDGAGGTKVNASSTTVTYPTLTPSGVNRLYVGFGTNGTASTSGQTAGYTVELDPGSNPYLYDPSVPNSAQTPTSVTTSSVSTTVGALIKADNPTFVQTQPVNRARLIRASHW